MHPPHPSCAEEFRQWLARLDRHSALELATKNQRDCCCSGAFMARNSFCNVRTRVQNNFFVEAAAHSITVLAIALPSGVAVFAL